MRFLEVRALNMNRSLQLEGGYSTLEVVVTHRDEDFEALEEEWEDLHHKLFCRKGIPPRSKPLGAALRILRH